MQLKSQNLSEQILFQYLLLLLVNQSLKSQEQKGSRI
jgi:hypothetical protein